MNLKPRRRPPLSNTRWLRKLWRAAAHCLGWDHCADCAAACIHPIRNLRRPSSDCSSTAPEDRPLTPFTLPWAHARDLAKVEDVNPFSASLTLDVLAPGSGGIIREVNGVGVLRRRLLEMGVLPGTRLTVQRVAPMGDPIEIRLRGYSLSLRKAEASHILVESSSAPSQAK